MKLIEALKKNKELQKKADDLRNLVKDYCVRSSVETDKYPDQTQKIKGWIHAYSDILKEVLRLRIAIQKTNLIVDVSIEIGDRVITKTIAEWIHRRRDLADRELQIWNSLTDKGIKEGLVKGPTSDIEVKIVRFYDPTERDNKRELFQSEPIIIDGKLEVVNAVTDLIE